MAKSALEYREVEKVITEREEFVTLELTKEEAVTLGTLLWCHIAGPTEGPRGILDGIGTALNKVLGTNYDYLNIRPSAFSSKTLYIDD